MKRYRLFADDTPLTPIANLIMAEDLEGLAQQMKDGWDINAVLPICRYIDEPPIELVFVENRLKVLHWLLARGGAQCGRHSRHGDRCFELLRRYAPIAGCSRRQGRCRR
jgi:hypothetical protein